ncbi:MAG: TetR/AcrR family transcriptional regulator [Bacteroidales bacterium]|jgi:AcrR family transcriptional regulator|nr:TetR/AcrR family transcriptional regulator [Bacteroidales bacterium]
MSPRTSQQFEEIREERKNLIMNAALDQFANVGFHAATISQIAKQAGISKGLMYNYFRSKEELLAGIINRSLTEIYGHFDPDHDGYLTEDEFELFIRKVFDLLKQKRQFWKLLLGIMLQRGVYENIFGATTVPLSVSGEPVTQFTESFTAQMADYFRRKQEVSGPGYDPVMEMLMFTNTVKGFAITFIFSDDLYPGDYFEKTIEAIIKTYR